MRVSRFSMGILLGAAVAAALGIMTVRQARLWGDSEALWNQALRVDPANYQAHNYLGTVFLNEGKNDQAIGEFRRALALAPGYVAAHKNLGQILMTVGDLNAACGEYDAALKLDPEQGDAEYNLGLCHAKQQHWDQAIEHYRSAIRLNASFVSDAHNNLGAVFLALNRLDDAGSEFSAAIRVDPRNLSAQNNLAVIAVRLGRYQDAIEQLKRILAIDPSNAEAAGNLEKLTQAVKTVKAGSASRP